MDSRRMWKIVLNILIPVSVVLLVYVCGLWALRFFLPFVLGWIIAMIASPLVKWLERHLRLVRRHSSVVVVTAVLALVIGVLYFAVSRLLMGAVRLVGELPGMFEDIGAELQNASAGIARFSQMLPPRMQAWVLRLNENLGSTLGNLISGIAFPTVTVAGNVAKGIPAAFVYTVVTILSSYFFIVEREQILAVLHRVIPQGVWDYFAFFKKDIARVIGGYFMAQFRIMFVVCLILSAGFLILRVRYAILWAVLIALLDFLPVFGTGTALFPWAAVKLFSGEWAFAVGLLALYVLTQVVRQIIQPKIVGDSMGIPPLTTLFLLYIGFKVRGISGMILAVPIGIFLMSLYKYGVFDSLIQNVRLLAEEINRFRKEE